MPWWAAAQLAVLVIAALVAVGVGVMLLLRTYRLREKAENDALQSLDRLIELQPSQFMAAPASRRG
ncbi:MAG: hypothetical protein FJ316_05080 [SAR202 cluster bacterium]|nr:hypothetical protein [SAR202 cluster bacterium]